MTDRDIGFILADINIVCDSREKKNQHILDYFKKHDIPHATSKLETADYSFVLPNYPHLGLDLSIIVEKKNSLDEIIGNFTGDRERFTREFERVEDWQTIHLLIEQATWHKLLKGSYRSSLPPKSLLASIMTWNVRYNCPIWYCQPDESPILIYSIIYYGLREKLKNIQKGT